MEKLNIVCVFIFEELIDLKVYLKAFSDCGNIRVQVMESVSDSSSRVLIKLLKRFYTSCTFM